MKGPDQDARPVINNGVVLGVHSLQGIGGGRHFLGMEVGNVAPDRNVNAHRIPPAGHQIIVLQGPAQPLGFDTHDGVRFRVKVLVPAKDIGCHGIPFDFIGLAVEDLLDDELEEFFLTGR
jgi:hypothetical protein